MYIGHLYKWKGIDIIVRAAEILSAKKDIIFILVGGVDEDIKEYKKIIENKKLINILLLGHKHKGEIPKFLKSADVLLLPNIPISQEAIKYTSPIKMFEYMASKKPIITSDLPSIREVLNKSNCVFFRPGDSKDMVKKIERLLKDSTLVEKISNQAYNDVKKYTWHNRMKRVVKFIF